MRLGTVAEWRSWVARGRHLWGSMFLGVLGVVIWRLSDGTGDDLRRLGLLYQVVGSVVVLADILDAMRRHGVKPPQVRLARYFRDVPCISRGASVTITGQSAVSIAFAGRGRASGGLAQNASVEQRLAHIEGRLSSMAGQIDQVADQVEAEAVARKAALAAEAEARAASAASVARAIRQIEVGSIELSLFGLLWLLIGTFMTTATPEACAWVLRCAP